MSDHDIETPVLIAGGGPVGMTLALELNLHGVAAVLCERNPHTTRHPKMDITNGRSMELFRRLGYSGEIRAEAIPETHPFDVVWVTGLNGWELARFDYPTVAEMWKVIKSGRDGTLPAEPNMRVSQVVVEPALKRILERDGEHIDVRFGWKVESFEQDDDGVTTVISRHDTGERRTVRSQYLIGCDGAGSRVRRGLGIETHDIPVAELMREAGGVLQNLFSAGKTYLRGERPNSGELYVIHFKSRDKEKLDRFGVAWHLQSPSGATLIGQNDIDTWTIHIPLKAGQTAKNTDPRALLHEALGEEIDADILVANAWRPQLGLAESYGEGRVWLAGDSAHQVIPAGGYGMNTGVGDAVDLGWKLAATLKGWGGAALLKSYQEERRPIGYRNREASKRHVAVRILISQASSPASLLDSPAGERARRRLGERITALGNLENEALGIEIGYRYRASPVICHESGGEPAYTMESYAPSTWPGARPPAVWLDDDTAIFDLFDAGGFTLIRLAETDASAFEKIAENMKMPLKVLDLRDEHIRKLYERNLVLVRPDQHVCWRGDAAPENIEIVLRKVSGRL